MKAKLVKHESKHESGYILFDEKGIVIGAEPNVLSSDVFSKLSFKNCQAIERGYDLDELATKICGNTINDFEKHDFFRQGFQEAIELMGDKKFSERNLDKAIEWGITNGRAGDVTHYDIDNFIQSLQQTEWDVTFNPDELDADGCLILKRI